MPPSSYKKEKLILKIYIRLLLYIKEKYNEILNPTALLQHLTNEINLINQDRALDKTFYDLFTTAAQRELETTKKRQLETAKKRELETAKKRELETAKKRELETVPKIETQEDVRRKMSEYMEKLIDTMKSMKEVYVAGDNSQDYLDRLKFPENLNDLTTLLQVLGERNEHMRTIYNDTNTTPDIANTIRIILLLLRRVELKILNAREEEDKRKQEEQAVKAGIQVGIQAERLAKVQAHRLAEKDDDGDGDDE
jgi:hypothetical protein